ncbi:hypothetical protein B0T16DRAFT_422036 [Cercophora newfieldiana]|uniref:Integral membrane protein n=1 Tax=Cercophora newfieldiana TaxID=92897 RepID=A0AA39XRH8_9PEZI|nr:hypothetical protein B0T16DRAFT_422036 [Cercophora newfieldiana]
MSSPILKNHPPPSGALTFLKLDPTLRYHPITPKPPGGNPPEEVSPYEPDGNAPQIYHVWRSRDNRKGRHAILLPQDAKAAPGHYPPPTNTLASTVRGILKMFTRFPIWDISYDVAVVFTFGCVLWVLNGFFVWYPLAAPWSEFPGESDVAGGWTAFVGATIFEFGSVLLMLEAVNEKQTECFGWALESAVESHTPRLVSPPEACTHHHASKPSWISHHPVSSSDSVSPDSRETTLKDTHHKEWVWKPSLHDLKSRYIYSISFWACLAQLIGATIFWISGFTALPPINTSLPTPALNGIYWLPQVVGGTGFIISSLLFMLEVQDKWYLPAPNLLGWHVGFWNLIGSVGFTLCGALGFAEREGEGVEYALALSTFVGSWAFLVGSVVQWYESLDKYPVSAGAIS